jgi:hypothetical protein
LSLVDAIAGLVERDIDFVFDALDGKTQIEESEKPRDENGDSANAEPKPEPKGKGDDINYRDEPVAFFFVLFGLAFEALVDQSTSASQRMDILQALKRILRPVISGNAIYQDAIFSESMDSFDRLALTEGTAIQNVIVEIARNLALDHPSAKGGEDRSNHLSDDIEQLFELTRSIILVLAGLLPNLRESTALARFNVGSDDALALIRLSLSSLVNVASIFPSIIRNDLNACILHIFSTILATGLCQAEVVPQALPTFRHFIQSISNQQDSPESQSVVSRQLRGCLTRFLTTLMIAQRRESESSLPCAKNTLLAITILLTTGGHLIPPHDYILPRILNEFLDCLQDVGLAGVAAGCIRSILLSPTSKSPTDEVIARYLTPRLTTFLVGIPSESGDIPNDPENSRTVIARTLVSCITTANTFAAEEAPTAMSLVMSCLLARAKREGESVHKETAVYLLELAKSNQQIFRALVASMNAEQKGLLEGVLRSVNVGAGSGADREESTQAAGPQSMPSIALRFDL